MKSEALQIYWHENTPIYSAHFEPHGKQRLATAGGDNMVRLWRLEPSEPGSIPEVTYLTTLAKHTNAVNVVRFSPKGEHLATAGDDGNVILWVPTDKKDKQSSLLDMSNENGPEQEHWRVKLMCRSTSGSGIYDIAWSPDGIHLLTGSMDNVARIYDTRNGQCVRQIAEHAHYIQGVAWDPRDDYFATQSSDRSLKIYNTKGKDGQLLNSSGQSAAKTAIHTSVKMNRSQSPAFEGKSATLSPSPSAPGTPTSIALPMRPPAITPSRRSSFTDGASNRGRSPSPMPGIPLPAVAFTNSTTSRSRTTNLFHDESLPTFFRRLTFTPDGSLLLAPAGQFKQGGEGVPKEELGNTVYIYTREGIAKPPVAHLPNQERAAVVIRCSPVFYKLKTRPRSSRDNQANNTTSADDTLGEKSSTPHDDTNSPDDDLLPCAFKLGYRIVFAVATGDAVIIYDTQQLVPLAVLSKLHYATFTDLAWSCDGRTLIMSSTDGFCSVCVLTEDDLGEVYDNPPITEALGREEMSQNIDFPLPSSARVSSPARSIRAASNSPSRPTKVPIAALQPTKVTIPDLSAQLLPDHSVKETHTTSSSSESNLNKRVAPENLDGLESVVEGDKERKKRRIQPTLVSTNSIGDTSPT